MKYRRPSWDHEWADRHQNKYLPHELQLSQTPSSRYEPDQYLPGKPIDGAGVIDTAVQEACPECGAPYGVERCRRCGRTTNQQEA